MAHKKAGGAAARQGANVSGKRLGFKISSGSVVKPGQIIIRQRGRDFAPGKNVMMGKDFTIFSVADGVVQVINQTKSKKTINVLVA